MKYIICLNCNSYNDYYVEEYLRIQLNLDYVDLPFEKNECVMIRNKWDLFLKMMIYFPLNAFKRIFI